jgi:hypothetical protein
LDYHFVSQGKITVPSIDDAEEMQFTDVRGRADLNESFNWQIGLMLTLANTTLLH